MITQAEWEIMRVLWYYKVPTSAQTIYDTLNDTLQWSESTVKTLLSRLVKKDYITYEKEGKQFLYYAKVQQRTILVEKVNQLLDSGCNKEKGTILQHVLQHVDLTKEDAIKIVAALNERLDKLPKTVPCHCKKGQCQCCQ